MLYRSFLYRVDIVLSMNNVSLNLINKNQSLLLAEAKLFHQFEFHCFTLIFAHRYQLLIIIVRLY